MLERARSSLSISSLADDRCDRRVVGDEILERHDHHHHHRVKDNDDGLQEGVEINIKLEIY
jgi:hypothetical protein